MVPNPIRHVVCAVSGGVDSAVSAYLLKQRGFTVSGVYMVNWDHVEEGVTDCPRERDLTDAQRICDHIGIPLTVVNFVKEYWQSVFQHLLENYRDGRTVCPDVRCNRLIKFGKLHEFAFNELKADAIATGHFARTNLGDFLEHADRLKDEPVKLLAARDPIKDQTYFLSTVRQADLRRCMFPVGSMLKPHVRQIARDIGLNFVAEKRESMGICFIGRRKKFKLFVDQYMERSAGEIRDIETGELMGMHEGVQHYTLGKRITADSKNHCPSGLFVAALDATSRTVYTCRGPYHTSLYAHELTVMAPTWIEGDWPADLATGESAQWRFRCQRTHPLLYCTVTRIGDDRLIVHSTHPIRAPAIGQSCVFYRSGTDECLGSGEIEAFRSLYDDTNCIGTKRLIVGAQRS